MICLTVSANIAAQGYFRILPENPGIDETGDIDEDGHSEVR